MKITKHVYDYFIIVIGCFLIGFAIEHFYLPHNMVTGGFSGLAIIITRYAESMFGLNISVSAINLWSNIPLFIITFFMFGYRMLIKSFFATIMLSVSLSIWASIPGFNTDMFISSIFGGVITGFGHGLVLSRLCTTGGTDIVAMIFNKYLEHINISKLLFIIDSAIIVLGLFVFGIEAAMYAIISVFVTTKMIDVVLEGLNFSKVAYIITDKYDEISDEIMKVLDRGVTGLESKGMYTKKQRTTLMVVVSTKELPKLKEIIKNFDEDAFMILTEAREVVGEGFKAFHTSGN